MPRDTARIHEVEDDVLAAIDYCYEQGWTDGLPVVPPDIARVDGMMIYEGRPPETVLAVHPATGLECTVHAAAVNAVMAGCKPEYFPVIVAALEALNEPEFNFHGSTASTGGSAPLIIVSGPVIDDIQMNADVNLFGPGNRANATIGRAIRLILMNVFRMIPGVSDKSTQGSPAKYSFCIAERARGNPWSLLASLTWKTTVAIRRRWSWAQSLIRWPIMAASPLDSPLLCCRQSTCASWPALDGRNARPRNSCSNLRSGQLKA
ncbi:MAG: hypothetical protein ACKVH0_11910 [Alphaproteobacteria bacterium]